jgi:hypothetical protein
MELIKIIGYIIIGFVVFAILITIAFAAYDPSIIKTSCKLWAQQIKEKGTASWSIPTIVGGYLTDFFCNIWWF